jgi:hypothetical protein
MATAKRKVVGKDDYGNDVFEGQVPIKDAHGNKVYEDADVRGGAAHLKEKHFGKPGARFTGRKDAHGNEIWESGKEAKASAAADEEASAA